MLHLISLVAGILSLAHFTVTTQHLIHRDVVVTVADGQTLTGTVTPRTDSQFLVIRRGTPTSSLRQAIPQIEIVNVRVVERSSEWTGLQTMAQTVRQVLFTDHPVEVQTWPVKSGKLDGR